MIPEKVDYATSLPRLLMWTRTDVAGSEVVVFDEADGLIARGSQHAVDPIPYRLEYELWTDTAGAATRLVAHASGAGWTRDLELRRSEAGWSCTPTMDGASQLTSFDGVGERAPARPGFVDAESLRDAFDIDIGGSPLTNALPLRRLGLLGAPPGTVAQLVSAWVLPPTLEVIASTQTYTVRGSTRIHYGDAGVGVEIEYDADGWVRDYPGLAQRVALEA